MSAYPAISLWQPWASLLFVPDGKVHETRHWAPPDRYINDTILIHASKKRMALSNYGPDLQRLCVEIFGLSWRDSLPYGAIVGAARLTSVQMIQSAPPYGSPDEVAGNWASGRYAWRFVNRRPFRTAIRATGHQGFWYPDEIGDVRIDNFCEASVDGY